MIEATKVRIVRETEHGRVIPSLAFEEWLIEILPSYFDALQDLEVELPFVVMISLQGVRGSVLAVRRDPFWFDDKPVINRDTLELPEVMIQRFGQEVDYQRAMQPALDALWNSAGYLCSQYFDTDGRWIGAQFK